MTRRHDTRARKRSKPAPSVESARARYVVVPMFDGTMTVFQIMLNNRIVHRIEDRDTANELCETMNNQHMMLKKGTPNV